jgi:hypothetical protein
MVDNSYSMVRWGAKETGLIVYKNEGWRLLSSVMLHGGIFHMIPNGAIQVNLKEMMCTVCVCLFMRCATTQYPCSIVMVKQLRVGGYLNLVYGTPKWFFIYFVSGIFGEMMRFVFFSLLNYSAVAVELSLKNTEYQFLEFYFLQNSLFLSAPLHNFI